jgi:RNA polymerase sigma-70 factor (ECF subfamily)
MDCGTPFGELIDSAVQGDGTALECLLLKRSGWIARYISDQIPETLRSAIDVDDLLQQTFVQAFRGIGQLAGRTEQSFHAWLATIAQNQLRDAVRALRRRKRNIARQATPPKRVDSVNGSAQLAELLSDHGDTPQRVAARREAIWAIHIGVAGLAHDQQQAIRLHCLERKSLDEAARIMNRSPNALRGLIHRGKQHLRQMLARSSRWLDKKR